MDEALLRRVECGAHKFDECIRGIDDVIALPDPIGRCDLATEMSAGLRLHRVSCPIGLLAVIFEARPDAAVQISSLALKAGNGLLLKGGKEAQESIKIVFNCLVAAMKEVDGFPSDCVQLVSTREEVTALLRMDAYVDLVVPRGSNQLVSFIKANTSIPVLGHADGLCYVYVHPSADVEEALRLIVDAKTDAPSACNAAEVILVDKQISQSFLPRLAGVLKDARVEVHTTNEWAPLLPDAVVTDGDDDAVDQEYLSMKVGVGVVDGIEAAVLRINRNGSHHTDCILATDAEAVETFMSAIDSAGVFANCSTRFADGFRYGFGAEVGISTNKIHARGPVGLQGLTIYKYRLYGRGHCVGEFKDSSAGPQTRHYTHKALDASTAAAATYHASLPDE
eukprot:GHVU01117544.1.p1 GENE.GHVU01117544.1~~GHVU01117544.1.p1  ORF type:complete len:394 (+),score=91.67 GHVU01117544.1:184-1365(+)